MMIHRECFLCSSFGSFDDFVFGKCSSNRGRIVLLRSNSSSITFFLLFQFFLQELFRTKIDLVSLCGQGLSRCELWWFFQCSSIFDLWWWLNHHPCIIMIHSSSSSSSNRIIICSSSNLGRPIPLLFDLVNIRRNSTKYDTGSRNGCRCTSCSSSNGTT